MLIAITSTADNVNAKIDPRFGRAAYFAIYNTENQDLSFFENPANDASEGAGPKAVQFVAEKKVAKVISGHFGEKVKALLNSLGIEMFEEKNTDQSIAEIIKIV